MADVKINALKNGPYEVAGGATGGAGVNDGGHPRKASGYGAPELRRRIVRVNDLGPQLPKKPIRPAQPRHAAPAVDSQLVNLGPALANLHSRRSRLAQHGEVGLDSITVVEARELDQKSFHSAR
jgi:hypothetical protein